MIEKLSKHHQMHHMHHNEVGVDGAVVAPHCNLQRRGRYMHSFSLSGLSGFDPPKLSIGRRLATASE